VLGGPGRAVLTACDEAGGIGPQIRDAECIDGGLSFMTCYSRIVCSEIAARTAESERLRLISLALGFRLLAASVFLVLSLLCWGFSGHFNWREQLPAVLV